MDGTPDSSNPLLVVYTESILSSVEQSLAPYMHMFWITSSLEFNLKEMATLFILL